MKKSIALMARVASVASLALGLPLVLGFAFVSVISCCNPKQEAVRPPQMGWSSWNAYMIDISDSIIMQQADLMVSMGLKDAGYNFVNIDDGYFGYRDSTGRLIPHPTRFPNGLKATVEHIHSLGLKAGIYSDAGSRTCGSWYNHDPNGFGVGLYGHDAQDCEMFFNELGFEFIKIDFCGYREIPFTAKERYTRIRQVMDSVVKKPVEFNLCRWRFPGTWASEVADSWRISGDIRPVWSRINYIVEKNKYLSAYAGGGRYNDMDMLAVGYNEHPSPFWDEGLGMSYLEEEAHFGMWCIMSSPLLLGCALEYMPERTREIVTNPELIAIDQDPLGLQAYTVAEGVFVKDILQRRGLTRAVALYNPADTARFIEVDPVLLELEGPLQVRDLNRRVDIDSLSMTLKPHQAKILRVTGKRRLEPTVYEAEWSFLPAYNDINREIGPKYTPCPDASNGAVVTALGASKGFAADSLIRAAGSGCEACADAGACAEAKALEISAIDSEGALRAAAENTLEWREVWSERGGRYQATVSVFPAEEVPFILTVNGQALQARTGVPAAITLRKGWNRVCVSSPDAALPPVDCLTLSR